MQARLARKAQRAHQSFGMECGRLDAIFDGNPELAAAVQFLVELGCGRLGRKYPVTVHPPKIAIDALGALNGLGAINRGCNALIAVTRTIRAAHPDQLVVAVIKRRRQMRGGARRHPAANAAAVQHHDRTSTTGELIGDR